MGFSLWFFGDLRTPTDTYCLVAGVIVALLCIPYAFRAGREFTRTYPERRAYTWGYWNGYSSISGSLVYILIMSFSPDYPLDEKLLTGAFYVYVGWLGWRLLQRRRHAWVWSTIWTVEPILWIINGIYMRNRWGEFKEEHPPRQPQHKQYWR